MTAALIELMAKHLPPSGSRLHLLDVDGAVGEALAAYRPDIVVHTADAEAKTWSLPDDSMDAVAVYNRPLTPGLLGLAQRALRPGGRLIVIDVTAAVEQGQVVRLEQAGYTRILVEPLPETPPGALMRGEKPHMTSDTLARIRASAQSDDLLTDLSTYPGRYVFLLIHQTPNKPVWSLREDEKLIWHAVTLASEQPAEPVLIAFSSLSKAVAFMQLAVLAGRIRDVNKVGKFRVETVRAWSLPLLLNPDDTVLRDRAQALLPVEAASAERSDE